MECKANKVTRRGFVAAATSGLALSGLAAGAALAEEASKAEAPADASAAGDTYDAIVVGSGLAGLCTGVRLLEDGVKNVLLVTKEDTMATAGNSRIAGGQFLFPMEDTDEGVQKMVDSFNAKSQGKGDADLTQLVCANSKAANDWLVSHGCSFTDPAQVQPYDVLAVSAAPGGGKGMPDLMDQMVSEFEAAGGQELVSAKLVDLVMDEATGAVSGVKVRTADGVQELSSPQVVIATGGYLANKGFMQASCGAEGDQILVRGNKTLTGDGLLAVERAGGMRTGTVGIDRSLHIAPVPPTMPALCPFSSAMYTVVVNSAGERFVDESLGYVAIGKSAYSQPGQTHALIFDSAAVEELDVLKSDLDKFGNFGVDVPQADTIEDLAAQIGVDPATLTATIDEFNAAIDGDKTSGLAIDKTACARPVSTAPFYAFYPMVPGGTQCFGGAYVDADCQALEPDGTPIAGLHVVGEAIGGIFAYDYIGGASLTRCVVSGMHVADGIAGK